MISNLSTFLQAHALFGFPDELVLREATTGSTTAVGEEPFFGTEPEWRAQILERDSTLAERLIDALESDATFSTKEIGEDNWPLFQTCFSPTIEKLSTFLWNKETQSENQVTAIQLSIRKSY